MSDQQEEIIVLRARLERLRDEVHHVISQELDPHAKELPKLARAALRRLWNLAALSAHFPEPPPR